MALMAFVETTVEERRAALRQEYSYNAELWQTGTPRSLKMSSAHANALSETIQRLRQSES
jgi:hypothetical protein